MKHPIWALALSMLCAPAFAGRPFTAEDAGFIEKGGFEFESYVYRQTERDVPAISGLHIQPSVGIGFNTQLGLGLGFARQYNEDYDSRKSSGDYALVGKTAIKPLTDTEYGMAIAYGAGRTREVAARYRYDNAYLNGVVSVPAGDWLLHANLGWQRSRLAGATATTWALAAERLKAFGPVDVGIETFGNDHDPAWLQVGARWTVKEDRLFLDASYGVQTGSRHTRLFTLGSKLAF